MYLRIVRSVALCVGGVPFRDRFCSFTANNSDRYPRLLAWVVVISGFLCEFQGRDQSSFNRKRRVSLGGCAALWVS